MALVPRRGERVTDGNEEKKKTSTIEVRAVKEKVFSL